MFEKNVRKSSKIRKKVDNSLFPRKMVDKDAICSINVMPFKFNQLQHRPDKCSVDLIFHTLNVANLGFCRIVPTIALQYRQLHYITQEVQALNRVKVLIGQTTEKKNKRGCFQHPPSYSRHMRVRHHSNISRRNPKVESCPAR